MLVTEATVWCAPIMVTQKKNTHVCRPLSPQQVCVILCYITSTEFDIIVITGLYPTTFDHKQIIRLSYCL